MIAAGTVIRERFTAVVTRRRLSAAVTGACAVILAGFVAFAAWVHLSAADLDTVSEPERALALIVGRTLELRDAMAEAPRWERRFYELAIAEGDEDLPQAIRWYEELARVSLDPGVELRLAVLRGEADRLDEVGVTTAAWAERGAPFEEYAALVEAAYLDGPLGQAPPVEAALPPGWFRDHVRIRLAERARDAALAATARAEEDRRGGVLLRRTRVLVVVHVVVLVAGLAAMLPLLRRHRIGAVDVAGAARPPLWSGRDGLVVLVRGGAAAAVLTLALIPAGPWMGPDSALLETLGIPLMNLPLLVMAQRRLLAPTGQSAADALGLVPRPGGWRPLLSVATTLVAAGIVIDVVIGLGGTWLGLESHWTEWFDDALAWGTPGMVAASLASTIVFAPVLEEIVFRGLLYGTLRRRLHWPLAAAVSAALFALAHGYGPAGFASVFLSGALWAIAYEATGSLLPGMIAHAANNLSASLAVLWLLR